MPRPKSSPRRSPRHSLRQPLRREDSFFGLHFDLHPHDKDTELGRLVTPAMVTKIIRAAKPDYIQYDCKGHVGYLGYPNSKVSAVAGVSGGETSGGGKGIINDSLAIYRAATSAAGVALFVHFSGVWDNVALRDHPEWAAINAEGKADGNATSTFGPYVSDRMIPQLKEVFDRYRVDGFWIDGDCWAAVPDYCAAARAKFQAATGSDTPPTKPGEPLWYEWMTVQRDQFFAYVKTYMDALHAYAPTTQIASNWLYSPLSPEPVKLPVDFISGDYHHSDSVNSARFNGRQMASVGLPWDLMAWAFSITSSGPHLYKSAEQLKQEAAAVLALGGGFQLYFHPDRHGGFPDWQIDVMGEVAAFCHARREVCHKTQPVPQVALLLDTTTLFKTATRVYTGGDYSALQGMLHAMLEAGHSVDVLCDHQLPWQQDHWPVIVVPEWSLLPVGVVSELVEYARRGGSLLITGAETCSLFAEHLGVELVGSPAEIDAAHLQCSSRPGGKPNFAAPMKGRWQEVKPASGRAASAGGAGAKVLAYRTTGRHPSGEPRVAATLARLGRGRIAAIYGPLGASHLTQHSPAVRDFVGGVLAQLYRPRVTVDSLGIDLAVREKDGRLIIHLCNVTGMPVAGERYQLAEQVPPIGLIEVTIRSTAKPKRVTLEPGGKKLPAKWTRDELRVTVPELAIHAAVVVE